GAPLFGRGVGVCFGGGAGGGGGGGGGWGGGGGGRGRDRAWSPSHRRSGGRWYGCRRGWRRQRHCSTACSRRTDLAKFDGLEKCRGDRNAVPLGGCEPQRTRAG